MEKENETSHGICNPGEPCAWGMVRHGDKIACNRGDGTCCPPPLLEAEQSDFHDSVLAEATQKINQILSQIPADSAGREVAFISTKTGILLAWVNHGEETASTDLITAQASAEDIAQALKLKSVQ